MMNHPNNFCFQLSRHLATAQVLPAGWRFAPTDEEIIATYLKPKVEHDPLPPNPIYQIDIRDWNPKTLAESYEPQGDGKWYFFTPRYKKDPNGSRPTRTVRNGFWKASGKDTKVRNKHGQDTGKKTTLVFYQGPSNKEGLKTNWIMHEYAVTSYMKSTSKEDTTRDPKLLDEWVLCEIHMHGAQNRKSSGFETLRDTLAEEEDGNTDKVTDNSKSVVAMGKMITRQVEHGMPIFSQTLPSHGTTSFDHQQVDILPMAAFHGDNNVVSSCNISSLNQNASRLQTLAPLTSSTSNSLEPSYIGWHDTAAAKGRDVVTFAHYDFDNELWLESDNLDFGAELCKFLESPTEISPPSKRQKIV